MIPSGVEVFVGVEPIDLRWGFERLTGVVAERCGRELRSRALFVFFGRHRSAVKLIYFDGTGLCLWYKRLDRGQFRGLTATAPHATVTRSNMIELEQLLHDVIEVGRLAARGDAKPRVH